MVALIAYERPEESPLRHLLAPSQREAVADAVNAAILAVAGDAAGGGGDTGQQLSSRGGGSGDDDASSSGSSGCLQVRDGCRQLAAWGCMHCCIACCC